MVDTNSVWIIVISLLLISIFVFGYYFYLEISQKEKQFKNNIYNRLEDLEKKVILNQSCIDDNSSESEQSDDSDYDQIHGVDTDIEDVEINNFHVRDSDSLPVIEEIMECEEDKEQYIDNTLEQQEENIQENKIDNESPDYIDSEKINSVFSDIKSLLGNESVIQNCKQIIMSGKRKGEECGKKVKIDGKCSIHA